MDACESACALNKIKPNTRGKKPTGEDRRGGHLHITPSESRCVAMVMDAL